MPRFRLFAGPNGSGKSTLYEYLRKKRVIHTEIYVCADRIEADLQRKAAFSFNAYRVKVSEDEWLTRIKASTLLSQGQRRQYEKNLVIQSGELKLNRMRPNSYMASLIADYLVHKLFQSKQSFCFETVMSHKSKIDILREAEKYGYRTYLYFVFTKDPALNRLRVLQRVKLGGHSVPVEKIYERFYRSLQFLPRALRYAERSYLIDNSVYFETVAVKEGGRLIWLTDKRPTVLTQALRS